MQNRSLPISIIIADDQPFFRLGVKNVLTVKLKPCNVTEAKSGIQVIETLETLHIDVAIIGMRICPLNGIETTEFIKQKFPKTKIIAFNNFPDPDNILKMYEKGADGFLTKYTESDELISAIECVMNGDSYFPDKIINGILKRENGIIKHRISKKLYIRERLREMIYLICMGLSSKEIAPILSTSFHTIEHDRLDLNRFIGANNPAGILKYGIQIGILEDGKLIKKFEKHFMNTRLERVI